jgi:hypothetical protein
MATAVRVVEYERTPRTEQEAEACLRAMVKAVGPGWHCDERFESYITGTGEQLFDDLEAARCDLMLRACELVLGPAFTDVAWQVYQEETGAK